jgi:hypothetical protein
MEKVWGKECGLLGCLMMISGHDIPNLASQFGSALLSYNPQYYANSYCLVRIAPPVFQLYLLFRPCEPPILTNLVIMSCIQLRLLKARLRVGLRQRWHAC